MGVFDNKDKALKPGMYLCESLEGINKGKKRAYHSSTAETLSRKGKLKVVKKITNYVPKTMKV